MSSTPSIEDELSLAWGATEIAKEIGRTQRATFHLLAQGAIKCAKKVGGRHCADRAALRAEFRNSVAA